ncbi:MAG: glycosyltransferase [Candidatus Kapabacteria bacterium]|nr:glycosyltransferase [Ignavibacteriota bacterium]MCW5884938.1 glycosyltransferase [Candidatus Kapabacteria bacterium]
MDVLHINTTDTSGSAIAAKRLSAGLNSLGINSKILSLDKRGNDVSFTGFFEDRILALKPLSLFQRHFLPTYRKIVHSIKNLDENIFTFPNTLIDITKHELFKKADIIHLHHIADFVDIKSFFNKNTKPIVWTIHDFNPISGGNHWPDSDISKFQKYVARNIEIKKNAYSKAKYLKVINPSEFQKNEVIKSGLFPEKSIKFIPHGVDFNIYNSHKRIAFSENSKFPNNNKRNIIFISDDHKLSNKGADLFIEIVNILGDKFNYIAVGKNTSIYCNHKLIVQIGFVSDENQLADIYRSADICLILSKFESFSQITIESLACGTPVISTNCGGPEEIIESGITGYIVKNRNAIKFAEIIENVMNDKVKLADMSEASAEKAKIYDVNIIARQYLGIYKELTHNK